MKDQDSIFFRNFSMLLGFLVLLTIVLAVAGYVIHNNVLGDDEMAKDRSDITEILEPVAKVNTGEAIVAEVETKTEAVAVAFDGSTDGKMIFDNVCFACHGTGAGGAPKLESAPWVGRLDKGLDGLVANAISGFQGTIGFMPAKGGRADLSDEQIKATVEFMIEGL
ncbi:MAG TPA: cytochrome c5 family protein [Oceanospirillales bacterium]|nr:cytochrome c5 family protein [Oceanospirillales bacterium]